MENRLQEKRKNIRYMDTDIMRIIASFCVVLFHTASYFQYMGLSDSFFVRAVNIICRFPVPVFFMISGRYMLQYRRGLKYILKKSLYTLGIIWVTSAIYTVIDIINGVVVFGSVGEAVGYVIAGPEHLWYLYALICLYLATPLFSGFARNASRNELLFIILLCIVLGSVMYIPANMSGFETIKAVAQKCKIGVTSGFAGCYLLGYYIYKYPLTRIKRYIIYLLGAGGLIFTAAAYYLMPFRADGDREMMLSFLSLNMILYSTGVFVFIKSITRRIPPRGKNIGLIGAAAKCTYGIYLWHVAVLGVFVKILGAGHINDITVLLLAAAVYVGSNILTYIYYLLRALIFKR